jgi:uncharacterized integral membrane protein
LNIFQLPAISTHSILTGLQSATLTEPTQPEPAPSGPSPARPEPSPAETRRERLSRHGRRTRLYAWTIALGAALVLLIAFIVANTERVKVSWVFGDTRTSLIWVIVVSGILGWLAGLATSILFRFRTRRRKQR